MEDALLGVGDSAVSDDFEESAGSEEVFGSEESEVKAESPEKAEVESLTETEGSSLELQPVNISVVISPIISIVDNLFFFKLISPCNSTVAVNYVAVSCVTVCRVTISYVTV